MSEAVTFVVPTFNRAADLPRTLSAIAAQDWPVGRLRIVVVDNGSTDDTASVLAGLDLPVPLRHVVKAPEGPASARNLGLRLSEDELVGFVDSDVELEPGWTRAAMAAMRAEPRLAQVGGPVVFAHQPGVLNCYGGAIGPLGLAWDVGEGSPLGSADRERPVLWLNNSATLVRRSALLAVGGFDEAFFYGYEEPDVGLRLAIAGWRSRVVPSAIAIHHVPTSIGRSNPAIVFHYTKNRFRVGLKAFGLVRLLWWVPLSLAYGLADAALHAPRMPRLRAMWWNVTQLGGTLRLRRAAQAARTVRDGDALALLDRRWFPPRRLAGMRRRPVLGTSATDASDDRVARQT